MTLNNFQWSYERAQPKRVGGKMQSDVISMLLLTLMLCLENWSPLLLILLAQVLFPRHVIYVDELIIWLCIVKWVMLLPEL